MFQLRPWARIQTPGLRFRLRILVPNAHDENFQQKKPNAKVWGGLLKQRQRLYAVVLDNHLLYLCLSCFRNTICTRKTNKGKMKDAYQRKYAIVFTFNGLYTLFVISNQSLYQFH